MIRTHDLLMWRRVLYHSATTHFIVWWLEKTAEFNFTPFTSGGGNTSGLARHLKRAHKTAYQEFKEASKAMAEEDKSPENDAVVVKQEAQVRHKQWSLLL